MVMMKWSSIGVLVVSLFLAGCGPKSSVSIVGEWTRGSDYYHFFKDGSFTMHSRVGDRVGTYQIISSDQTIMLSSQKGDVLRRIITPYAISEDGGRLVLEKSFTHTLVLRRVNFSNG